MVSQPSAQPESESPEAVGDTAFAPPAKGVRQFPCTKCGAGLVYSPGTTHLTCKYCGENNDIPPEAEALIQEIDYELTLRNLDREAPLVQAMAVKCNSCGAESHFGPGVSADKCPFCGKPIVATAIAHRLIKPACVLPFAFDARSAGEAYGQWLGGRWFAPNDLKEFARKDGLKGVYVPAWTYDCRTASRYTGYRGDDYWVTETYTAYENGRNVTRTRQVRKTRWTYVSGQVRMSFDDVLVIASQTLPDQSQSALEPWDLKKLLPYQDEYLSGFTAQVYQIDLPQGFERAKGIMDGPIRGEICSDIGGDHQRIDGVETNYANITFKHILLPVWIGVYNYRAKVFQFIVNARTGQVWGTRPYSVWKITFLVLAICVLLIVVGLMAANKR